MQNPFLIGSNVYLRPLEREDARTLVPWFNDPEVMRFTRRYQPMNLTQEEEFLSKISADPTNVVLGIVEKEGGGSSASPACTRWTSAVAMPLSASPSVARTPGARATAPRQRGWWSGTLFKS